MDALRIRLTAGGWQPAQEILNPKLEILNKLQEEQIPKNISGFSASNLFRIYDFVFRISRPLHSPGASPPPGGRPHR
jgi:hypothetical protein